MKIFLSFKFLNLWLHINHFVLFVLVSLAQLIWIILMHNICEVRGSNLSHHKKNHFVLFSAIFHKFSWWSGGRIRVLLTQKKKKKDTSASTVDYWTLMILRRNYLKSKENMDAKLRLTYCSHHKFIFFYFFSK